MVYCLVELLAKSAFAICLCVQYIIIITLITLQQPYGIRTNYVLHNILAITNYTAST